MDLIDQRIRKIDFLISLSEEEVEMLYRCFTNQISIKLDKNDADSEKNHNFVVDVFYKFLCDLKEGMDKNGIRSNCS